jgi:DNA helicase-2/ATP-dependent DNA helicase PcrA
MPRSPEQQAFRDMLEAQPTQSIILNAVAGSGKTTTLIDSLDVMKGSTCLMAFNKKIAVELEERISKLSPMVRLNTAVGTVHSLGFRAWKQAGNKSRVEGGKLNFLLKDFTDGMDRQHPLVMGRHLVRNLVSFAKQGGFDLQSDAEFLPSSNDPFAWSDLIDHFNLEGDLDAAGLSPEEAIKAAQTIFKQSNQQLSLIDFDDMIYLPLLHNLKMPQYQNVLIDEAQDTNVTRRELAFRMLKPGGRVIAVGDPHQAIYGFTGADASALQNIARRAKAVTMPLSVCWRCDQKIIEHARKVVSHITSFDTEGRGHVDSVPFNEDFLDRLQEGDTILCRLNKPNVSVAVGLLRRGRTARIEGRDLGTKLMSHARKAAPDMPPLDELLHALGTYQAHQVDLLIRAEKHTAAALLEDEIEALIVLIDRCLEQGKKRFADLDFLQQELFQDDAHKQRCILLSSVHKSKGLEWPRVYLLGRSDYMPFFKAEMEWEQEQEQNLIYVAITRAKHELIEVTEVKSALDKGLHRLPSRVNVKAIGKADIGDLRAQAIEAEALAAIHIDEKDLF